MRVVYLLNLDAPPSGELRATIGRASADFIDLKAYEADMRFLIDNYIMAEDSKKIGSVDDFTLLDFIAGKQEDEQPQDTSLGGHDAVAETIENNTRKKIVQKRVINPKFYDRMSAILASLILDRKQGVIRYEEMLEKYRELAERVKRPEEDISYPESVRSSEALRSLFDNSEGDEELTIRLHDAVMTTKMDHFRGNKQKENKIKKGLYEILQNMDEVERIFKIVVAQEEY